MASSWKKETTHFSFSTHRTRIKKRSFTVNVLGREPKSSWLCTLFGSASHWSADRCHRAPSCKSVRACISYAQRDPSGLGAFITGEISLSHLAYPLRSVALLSRHLRFPFVALRFGRQMQAIESYRVGKWSIITGSEMDYLSVVMFKYTWLPCI